jgi:hypothetical protein
MLSVKMKSGECVIRIGAKSGCPDRSASAGWTIHIQRGIWNEPPWSDPFAMRQAAFDWEDSERALSPRPDSRASAGA